MRGRGLLLAAGALLSLAACSLRSGEARPAPPFALSTPKGERVTLEDCDGKVCILAIWASWCAPCREEVPVFNDLSRRFGDDLLVVGISVDEDPAALRRFLEEEEILYTIVLGEEAFLRAVGFTGSVPSTLVLGPGGKIRLRYSGYRPLGVLEGEVNRLLGRRAALPPDPAEKVPAT